MKKQLGGNLLQGDLDVVVGLAGAGVIAAAEKNVGFRPVGHQAAAGDRGQAGSAGVLAHGGAQTDGVTGLDSERRGVLGEQQDVVTAGAGEGIHRVEDHRVELIAAGGW